MVTCRNFMASCEEVLKEVYNYTDKELCASMMREGQHAVHNMFLVLLVMPNFGVASAASDNVQRRERLEEIQWEKEVGNCCKEKEVEGKFQE